MNREEHLLICLNEECLEVAKEITKSLRFGLDDWEPGRDSSETNRKKISHELSDLIAVAQMLKDELYIDEFINEEKIQNKKNKVEHFLLYSKNKNKLD